MDKKIFETELKKIVEISKEYGAEKIILFGSCLKNIKSANDIDIAVAGVKPRDFFYYYGKVSMTVDDRIDIVDLDEIKGHLYNRILDKGKVLYEKSI